MADLSRASEIWSWMKNNTQFSDEAIAGIMGNLKAESNCEPCRVQGDFDEDRKNSKTYASTVDGGNTSVFTSGKYGWGLCQWTYPARCFALYTYCKNRNVSIADLEAQLGYMMSELATDEFYPLYKKLLACTDISTAATLFCKQYEMPYEQEKNSITRTAYGMNFYAKYHATITSSDVNSDDTEEAFLEAEIEYRKEELARDEERIAYYEERLRKLRALN